MDLSASGRDPVSRGARAASLSGIYFTPVAEILEGMCVLLTLIWATSTLAQPSGEEREKRFQRVLERFDKDEDRQLSEEERAAAKEEKNLGPKDPALAEPHRGS